MYRSRSQYREVTTVSAGRGAKNARSRGEADRRQTIAERKRAEALAGDKPTNAGSEGDSLMPSMNEFGNNLYSGKTSFPFVGKRRLWSSSRSLSSSDRHSCP